MTAPGAFGRRVISGVIRGVIGFDGVLVSDDLSMHALGGDIAERAGRALAAGCDLVLHCNADRSEMEAIVAGAAPIASLSAERLARAEAMRYRFEVQEFDRREAEAQFEALLADARLAALPAR